MAAAILIEEEAGAALLEDALVEEVFEIEEFGEIELEFEESELLDLEGVGGKSSAFDPFKAPPTNAKFKTESAADAGAKGLNVKNISGAISAASGIIDVGTKGANFYTDFLRSKIKDKKVTQDIIDKRREVGLVLKRENRRALILERKIPQYYASDHIKRLIRQSILPYGWGVTTALHQGFGPDINAVASKQTNDFNTGEAINNAKIGLKEAREDTARKAAEKRKRDIEITNFYNKLLF